MSDFWSDPLSTPRLYVSTSKPYVSDQQRSEPLLVAYVISTIISWAGFYNTISGVEAIQTVIVRVKCIDYMDRVKRIWYLSLMRAAKVQASLRIRAVSPEPSLLAHTSSESRGTFRQKTRSLAPLNGWVYAVKICHDGMLEDTNSLDGAHIEKCISYGHLGQNRVLMNHVIKRCILQCT